MLVSCKLGRFSRILGLLLGLLVAGSLAGLFADPGAASFALGGLQFKKEPRISMLSEKLTIDTQLAKLGPDFKVEAEYEFSTTPISLFQLA
jgi:hypothetical protein